MVFTSHSIVERLDPSVRVLIVDDSVVMRNVIARVFQKNPVFQVVDAAENGENAIQKLREYPADVIILDSDMPVMDGLTAIPLLKAIDPAVQIIMAATLTRKDAEISLRALALGATDYILKPSTGIASIGLLDFTLELTEKVRVLGSLARRKGVRLKAERSGDERRLSPASLSSTTKSKIILRPPLSVRPSIIAIGSSTGGPEALFKLIQYLGNDLPQPVIITQHMPPIFTLVLAEHISRQCNVVCQEGRDAMLLKAGHYYLAPGDFHMVIEDTPAGPAIKRTQAARENFCRPAVDPMLRSISDVFGARVLVVMLTGMGKDGLKGSETVVASGGCIMAQNQATSIVWGMPGAVAMAGLCSAVLPLDELAVMVRNAAMKDSA